MAVKLNPQPFTKRLLNNFLTTSLQQPPLSLYIHIPWCVKKCPYCDFNSHEKNSSFNEDEYIDALLSDLRAEYSQAENRQINSIFFGGGTPSLFSAKSINRILNAVKSETSLTSNIEITLEANPGTFEQEKFSAYRETGINRLSIGIQSFNDTHLSTLGRIHDSAQAQSAINTAKRAGFDNINIDLMFALPEQTIEQAAQDVLTACDLDVNHISHYQLTIEPNTYFHKYPPPQPDNDYCWEMQQACDEILSEHKYRQYEVSAFSKTGAQCTHNNNYWLFGDYIGIGAGAHGKITSTATGEITRHWKRKQPADYIRHAQSDDAASGYEIIKKENLVFEFLMNSLRLKDGFDPKIFEQRTGLKKGALLEACKTIDNSMLDIQTDRIRASEEGYRFLNSLLEKLL